jgi:CheY-like chemotaxis protein
MRAAHFRTPGRRVLIVDDHPDSAEASCMLLALLGHDASPATCGLDALAEVERLHPEVVICDLGLPDISGFEVARAIRTRHGSELYLASLTGWDQPAERARALAAGFDQHLIKPANVSCFRQIMAAAELGGGVPRPRGSGVFPAVV